MNAVMTIQGDKYVDVCYEHQRQDGVWLYIIDRSDRSFSFVYDTDSKLTPPELTEMYTDAFRPRAVFPR